MIKVRQKIQRNMIKKVMQGKGVREREEVKEEKKWKDKRENR